MTPVAHLKGAYPALAGAFAAVEPVTLTPRDLPVAEAVTRIVIGQMLSRRAAAAIYDKVARESKKRGCVGSWELPATALVNLGVSGRKAKTITQFADAYAGDCQYFEQWRYLDHDSLRLEVSKFWGMSKWSADILGIFCFGNEDIFPESDGTIKTVIRWIEQQIFCGNAFNPQVAAPFRSYLSLMFWKMNDTGYIASI